jgi:hypothetical protein
VGLISIVKQFVRAVVDGAYKVSITHDPGYPDSNDAEVYGPSGDDSPPLPEDFALLVETPGAGRQNVAGYMDTRNEGVAEPGEVRRYARDPDGVVVATIWMKGDGTITIVNDNGSIEMAPSGDVTINGVTIDTSGNISTPGDIEATGDVTADGEVTAGNAVPAAKVTLSAHVHTSAAPGSPTSTPTPGF